MVSTKVSSGESYSQHEPLTTRLNGLIHDYPEGIGIFKELIQNADDAGAKCVEFIIDWRTHVCNDLQHPELSELAGPAMLVFNDAVFEDADFEGLKKLGQGGKRTTLRKTGRFGLGFNSVYNMTDHPSLISREYICFFDPHGSIVPETSTKDPGRRWKLQEFIDPSFLDLYSPGGMNLQQESFNGTLFRFPFRTERQAMKSEISSSPFTREKNVEPLISKLLEVGEELLLFLKSIQELKVREVKANGEEIIRLHITTRNSLAVGEARDNINNILANLEQRTLIELCEKRPDQLPNISYLHEIEITTPDRVGCSTWRVVSLLRVDSGSEMTKVMSDLSSIQEKAVPWGGAAARIISDDTVPIQGKQYCFLPLPELTGLPIHINGYFDLNSSRKSSTGDETSGNARARSQWNKLIVKHVVAPACAQLVRDLAQDLGDVDTGRFYSLWPIGEVKSELFNQLTLEFIKAVDQFSVLRSNLDTRWVKPQDILILKEQSSQLFDPLSADKVCLPSPTIPRPILKAFQDADHSLKEINPEWLRNYLRKSHIKSGIPLDEAPLASLHRLDWITELLKYCLSDKQGDLLGLPLCFLASGKLQYFEPENSRKTFLASVLQRKIFETHPEWFLHIDIENSVPELLQAKQGITVLTPELLVEQLQKLEIWAGENPQLWKPNGTELPNAEWLSLIYQYFGSISAIPVSLSKLTLVPGNDGNLYQGGQSNTPLWSRKGLSDQLKNTFEYFGIRLVTADTTCRSAIQSFFQKHPLADRINGHQGNDFIWPLTVSDVVDTLYTLRNQLPPYNSQYYSELISYFNRKLFELTSEAKSKLRKLPIFSTLSGVLVTLSDTNVYLPADEPPEIPLKLNLIWREERWERLFETLQVEKLSLDRLMRECILPNYRNWDEFAQRTALEWIRSTLDVAVESLRRRGENYSNFQQQVRSTPLIRCTDGKLRPAIEVYRPGEQIVMDVLGGDAPLPDMTNTYATEQDLWIDFFDKLGISRNPRPQDLVDHAERLRQKCNQTSVSAVSAACLRLLYYIEDNWDNLKAKTVRVANNEILFNVALTNKEWLPAELDARELAKYPGTQQVQLQQRLYRPEQLLLVQDANLAASQRPIVRLRRQPRAEIQQGLGFRPVSLKEVLKHFDYLITTWERDSSTIDLQTFKPAIGRVYSYFNDYLVKGNVDRVARDEFKKRYSQRRCLWDGKGKFWLPAHVFEKNASSFGERRISLGEHRLIGVYRLLGQRSSPVFQDYLDFVEEVKNDFPSQAISDEKEVDCIIKVLNRMARVIEDNPNHQLKPNFLLTEDTQLLEPSAVVMPDAPWYEDAVREMGVAKLLHLQVDRRLADAAGSPSLLRTMKERPAKDGIVISSDLGAKERATIWENHLRSLLFHHGLERLIRDEGKWDDTVPMNFGWLSTVKVKAASNIWTDLFWGARKIAQHVEGDSYFDKERQIFYVRHDSAVGVDYLASCLNQQLDLQGYPLNDKSKLIRILEASPKRVSEVLDSLRVRSLQRAPEILEVEEEDVTPADFYASDTPSDHVADNTVSSISEPTSTSQEIAEVEDSPESQTLGKLPAQPLDRIGGILAKGSNGNGASSPSAEIPAEKQSDVATTDDFTGSQGVVDGEGQSKDVPNRPQPRPTGNSSYPNSYAPNGSAPQGRKPSMGTTSKGDKIVGLHRPQHSRTGSSTNGRFDRQQPTTSSANNGKHPSQWAGVGQDRSATSKSATSKSATSKNGSSSGSRGDRWKTCVYTSPEDSSDHDTEKLTQATRVRVDKAGMERVMSYERAQGRTPTPMPTNHPGYDIESIQEDGSVRYIEVKSFQKGWRGSGAKISQTQFWKAKEEGRNFWLYVVECAEDDLGHTIYPIQDPANRTKEFYFDDGWKELAQAEVEEAGVR